MRHLALMAAAASFALIAGTSSAVADDCSGHDHTTGTVVGAGGGALIGGLATHSVAGVVIGGVVGGLAGNTIARSNDCERQDERSAYYEDRDRQQTYDDQQAYDNQQRQQAYGNPRALNNRQRQQAYDDQQQQQTYTQQQPYDQRYTPQAYDDRARASEAEYP